MPDGPILKLPEVPWTQPESVFDSGLTRAMRVINDLLGGTDPNSIMGIVGTLDVPGGAGALQRALNGLYSRVNRVAEQVPAKGVHPNRLRSLLQSGAAKEEVEYRKIPEFLASHGEQPVTREALEGHLAANPAPFPQVVTKSEPRVIGHSMSGEPMHEYAASTAGQPKFSQYQLPGGDNYRETLLTLPDAGEEGFQRLLNQRQAVDDEINRLAGGNRFATPPPELVDKYNALQRQIDGMQHAQFRSSHFDEPNILVHVRSNERTLPTGERGRFLEEVQSDWHQKGKKEGYRLPPEVTAPMDSEYRALVHKNADARAAGREPLPADVKRAQELESALMRADASKIPDAPFKDSWPDLGLKQQLLEAANDDSLQWLGFTSGQTQAARYDLSKQVRGIEWTPYERRGSSKLVTITPIGGNPIELPILPNGRVIEGAGTQFDGRSLDDIIGKDIAGQILGENHGSLAGGGLTVGGEGMRKFYDEILPKRLEKIVKPFGGKVEQMTVRETGNKDLVGSWIVRLTPEMKAKIKAAGLPLAAVPFAISHDREDQK